MVTLHFSECCLLPTDVRQIPRPIRSYRAGEYYEKILSECEDGDHVGTYDELCVLVAQWLHARKIKQFRFASYCNCVEPDEPEPAVRTIELEDDGSMKDDPFHGYFRQRMKYLR